MDLGSIGKAVKAVTGAPTLYQAARKAGASHADAADVMAASATALSVAAARNDGTPGRQNAMRHFIWQAYLAGRHGLEVAQAVAAAQEDGRNAPVDSRIDEQNNAVGQRYGVAQAAEIREGSMRAALDRLADVAAEKWEAGELVWIRGR
ncbi:hypothetical protein DDE18_18180 [Nocardioides gansuensis]|uniref:DUF6973 domain-containing protein n=2 Tax=Nocardioides gansuensis TaxID=2138300 RepID=A0A2T8F6T0_9ACTN|nr:hypothetical protein DDE18_18180 [Nocardioides gansuensis]